MPFECHVLMGDWMHLTMLIVQEKEKELVTCDKVGSFHSW